MVKMLPLTQGTNMFFRNNPSIKNEFNKEEQQQFYIGDLLSVVTGKALSKKPFEDLAKFLKYMTGDSIWSHQIGTISKQCKPYVLAQFPQLEEVDISNLTKSNYDEWMQDQIKKYGEYFKVKPIPKNEHQPHDPIEDIIKMREGKTDGIIFLEAPTRRPGKY